MLTGGVAIRLHPFLKEARFVARPNRFVALMDRDGQETMVHVANSGRLGELLHPDNRMLLAPAAAGAARKTAFDLALVEFGGVLVSVDSRIPNSLLRESIEAGSLARFTGYDHLAGEVTVGDSRLDIVLSGEEGRCYIEAKSVTLVEGGVALFPDAPTERGRKHLGTLSRAAKEGDRAAVVFVIQRPDASSFAPNEEADPQFSRALREAAEAGVEVYAYRCNVDRRRIELSTSIPVRLD